MSKSDNEDGLGLFVFLFVFCPGLLTIILLFSKEAGKVDWSYFWVFSPALISLSVVILSGVCEVVYQALKQF